MPNQLDRYKISEAVISDCERYRYRLTRIWDESLPIVYWIMLNPSTADGLLDDPTIRRVVGFSERAGYGGVMIINLFAWRSTTPSYIKYIVDLGDPREAIGPENHKYLEEALYSGCTVVAGWGNHGKLANRGREIKNMFPDLKTLRVSKNGYPSHPLYLPNKLEFIGY